MVKALTAMYEEQGDSALDATFLMDVVYIQRPKVGDGDVARELRKLFIQRSLLCWPVEISLPVVDQPLDIFQRRAIFRASIFEFVWECRELKFLLKDGKFVFRDGDLERLFWARQGRHGEQNEGKKHRSEIINAFILVSQQVRR